jgi:hypothetical protein
MPIDPSGVATGATPERFVPRAYPAEWALFVDYCAAADQPALPTTLAAVRSFFADVSGAPATRRRRLLAISRAHRDAGALLYRPPEESAHDPDAARREAGRLLAACPTRGWPAGFTGRRDAFLIVLTRVLGYSHAAARTVTATDIEAGQGIVRLRGKTVPVTEDPRTCPRCVVVRWLAVLDQADGVGRHDAYQALTTDSAPTVASEHFHTLAEQQRWRRARSLLPPIDQHGWIDDYHPVLSLRSIGTRLAAAAAHEPTPEAVHPPSTGAAAAEGVPAAPDQAASLDDAELFALLADVENGAAELNARIEALLRQDSDRRRP